MKQPETRRRPTVTDADRKRYAPLCDAVIAYFTVRQPAKFAALQARQDQPQSPR